MKFIELLVQTSFVVFVFFPGTLTPMSLRLLSTIDSTNIPAHAQAWHDFVPELISDNPCDIIALPISGSCITRANELFTQDPDMAVHQPFDPLFARELLRLNPPQKAHAVHVLAQQAALVYHTIHIHYSQPPANTLSQEGMQHLETFLITCPPAMRTHIMVYAYLRYTQPEKHTCLCQDFNRFIRGAVSEILVSHITNLPGSRQRVLEQAAREQHEDIALYALAHGADYRLPVREKSCRCCKESFLIPAYYSIPLKHVCTHMPRLQKRIEELETTEPATKLSSKK